MKCTALVHETEDYGSALVECGRTMIRSLVSLTWKCPVGHTTTEHAMRSGERAKGATTLVPQMKKCSDCGTLNVASRLECFDCGKEF